MQRIRATYTKTESLRYTGNLDVHKIWERILRRAHLPISYSKGFHPHPRINQACPLPLGITSQHEILDFWLSTEKEIGMVQTLLEQSLLLGIKILKIESIQLNSPALQTQVIAAEYTITFLDPFEQSGFEQLKNRLGELMSKDTLMRNRRGKEYDLKPLIQDIALHPPNNENLPHLSVILAARQGATGRPEEVACALDLDLSSLRIERVKLVLTSEKNL
ncbi:MAG: TIGR03936 family radical SAM-associated protein [Anaerolineaceae bacterium]|nr:TIGR03936 family radical SAM-associated protein [Anaerolineaceae bacterium]